MNRRKTHIPRNQPQPILAASPLIRAFFTLADEDGLGTRNIAEAVGALPQTISGIRHGRTYLSIKRLERLCETFGYEIIIRRKT